MNDVDLLREHGPAAPPLRSEVRAGARAALTAEIIGTAASRRLLSRRRLAVIGTAAVAACAAAVAGIALTGAPPSMPEPPPSPPGPITLVAFETPSFPVTLRPEPPGLTVSFNRDPSGLMMAIYRDGSDLDGTGFVVSTGQRIGPTEGETVEDVTINGRDAQFVTEPIDWGNGTVGTLLVVTWQRSGGDWLTISADLGAYERDSMLALAATVVDEPQPAPLELRLAPAGWSVLAFKERVLTLVDDADESRTMSINVPFEPPLDPAELARQVGGATGEVRAVTVHGRPALLVPGSDGWGLQAAFPDGTPFRLHAPAPFTADDVVAVANTASYTP